MEVQPTEDKKVEDFSFFFNPEKESCSKKKKKTFFDK
jgi:hypothetical protein